MHQIEKSIVFIRDNGSVKQKIKDLPRKSYTLNELEARFNEEALVSLLNQVAQLQKSWDENTKKLTYWQQAEDWANQWLQYDVSPTEQLDSAKTVQAKVAAESWEIVETYLTEQKDVYYELNYSSEKEIIEDEYPLYIIFKKVNNSYKIDMFE